MSPPKVSAVGKEPAHDPRITAWDEEEEANSLPNPARRPRGRSLRDWGVLFLSVLLVFYVVLFLFGGGAAPAKGNASSSGNFFFSSDSIAVIPLHGEIGAESTSTGVGYQGVVDALKTADNDSSIAAILLDIDSGGGSVVASKQIVAKIRAAKKPVVSWIGEVGASGAYYAAAASTYVMADSDSITGSIGVISRVQTATELMDKLGIRTTDITTGPNKGIGSPFADFNANQQAIFQALVDQAFEGFKNDVVAFRGEKLKQTPFQEVLDGRIISGKQALAIGLIDQLGTREEAIQKAAELGGIQGTPTLVPYLVKPITLRDLLFSAGVQFGGGFKAAWMGSNGKSTASIEAK